MSSERWIKIMLCNDGDARANTIEDGVLWVTRAKWAKIRNDKRIRQVNGPPVIINGEYVVEREDGGNEGVPESNRDEPKSPTDGGN